MFDIRPKIDTTFGVPMDLDAPSGAMLKRRDKPKRRSTAIPTRPQTANRPVATPQVPPRAWKQPSASSADLSSLAKYLRPPVGFRLSLVVAVIAYSILGPALFLVAGFTYVAIAVMRWKMAESDA